MQKGNSPFTVYTIIMLIIIVIIITPVILEMWKWDRGWQVQFVFTHEEDSIDYPFPRPS